MSEKPKFIVIYYGEAKELGLTNVIDLAIYSLIYGFCQDEDSDFHGSLSYIKGFLDVDKCTILRSLQRLQDMRLITKESEIVDGVKVCHYRCTGSELQPGVVADCNRGGSKLQPGGGCKMQPNNIDKIIKIKERERMFADEVRSLAHAKGWEDKDDIEKFISYWSEPNQSKTKMRFEMEKTWDTSRRINTWKDRSSRENGKRMPQPEQPTRPFRTVDDLKK